MNHGGPYPSTSHPGSTSVGIPASITRFAKLDCYDAVRPERLPAILKDTIANSQHMAIHQRSLGQGITDSQERAKSASQSIFCNRCALLLQMLIELLYCASE